MSKKDNIVINEKLKAKYEAEIVEAVKKYKFMRFNHVFNGSVSIGHSTAYYYELEKSELIKEALQLNRMKGVDYLLQKWIASDNPTLQIAAMRLICDPDDHRRLNQQYLESNSFLTEIKIEVQTQKSEKELNKFIENVKTN